MLCISNFSMEVIKFSVKIVYFWQCGSSDKLVNFKIYSNNKTQNITIYTPAGCFL